LLADFFDTVGTMTATAAEAGLLDEDGSPPGAQRILNRGLARGGRRRCRVGVLQHLVRRVGGRHREGARTGLASVVTGALFLLATFLAPLVAIIPNEAAAPALVVVGFLMMTQVRGIDWDDYSIAIPAFLTIILMPFTYSITAGIGAGFLSYVVLRTVRGRAREVHR